VQGLMGNKWTSSEDGIGYLQWCSLKAIITRMSLARRTVGFGMSLITGVWVLMIGCRVMEQTKGMWRRNITFFALVLIFHLFRNTNVD